MNDAWDALMAVLLALVWLLFGLAAWAVIGVEWIRGRKR